MWQGAPMAGEPAGRVWSVHELRARHAAAGRPYDEVLRVDALSFGLYRLPAGSVDGQSPHREDEVYVVLVGAATVEVDGVRSPVTAGSVLYVQAGAPHRFLDVTDDLDLAVVFAPPESG